MVAKVTADISRQLKSEDFSPSSTITFDIPKDTVLKHLQLRLSGAIQVTYASGSPVSDQTAPLNRLINYIDVTANGSFTIKNVTPWMMHMQGLMAQGEFGTRLSQSGASATSNVTQDSKFVIPTTTEYSSNIESVMISFENVLAGQGRTSTFWDTRGLSSAVMKVSTASYDNLLEAGSDPVDSWDNSTFELNVSTIEVQDVPKEIKFNTFKQTTQSVQFSSQVSEFRQSVNRGNFLQGFLFEVRNGDTAKSLSNIALSDIKLILNGSSYIQNTTFKELQEKNRARYGLNVPFESDVSKLDGVAYLDLLTPTGGEKFGALSSAQSAQSPNVDEVQLGLTTTNDADYTNNVQTQIMTNEIIRAASE